MPTDARDPRYAASYLSRFPQHRDLVDISSLIIAQIGTTSEFVEVMGKTVRRAFDEVIDMPRTGRWRISDLEKTEKTYIGTKVEILTRHELSLSKGRRLDLELAGHEIDVKNTVGSNWAIPREAVNELCLIISGSDERNVFSVGLFRALTGYLTQGENQDGKKTISSLGKESVYWIARDAQMSENFMASLSSAERTRIMAPRGGTPKLCELFRTILKRAIHRDVISGLGQQKDALKRIRKNGGARDQLRREDIFILSGARNRDLLAELGFGEISSSQFLSIRKTDLIRQLGSRRAMRVIQMYDSVD